MKITQEVDPRSRERRDVSCQLDPPRLSVDLARLLPAPEASV
jgi:hypothetical protein